VWHSCKVTRSRVAVSAFGIAGPGTKMAGAHEWNACVARQSAVARFRACAERPLHLKGPAGKERPLAVYFLHGLCLEVCHEVPDSEAVLDRLLLDLSCVPSGPSSSKPDLRLSVYLQSDGIGHLVPTARELFRADGFRGLEHGDDFYVTDGTSLLHL